MTTASQELYDDVALKPKLLRSLLREYVPDDKHPFTNPSELSYVVSTVKGHKLLSERAPQALEEDSIEAWKSAVDSWVHRLLTLASSNSQEKCWVGICLLGVTGQECSPQRFLASYAIWFDKLLMHIKPPAVSYLVKAACCASLSDIFTRLSIFPNARKDGTSQATKVMEAVLKLLNEDSSDFVLEEAVNLLCTLINFFPVAVHRHYESVEAAIVSRLMSGKCCAGLLKKLSRGLSLLPKSRGDEASWTVMMQKILLCLDSQLNDAFQGIEEEARSSEAIRAISPYVKEPPSPLGGLAASQLTLDGSIKRPEQVLGSRISTLMQCCCDMLTVSYPVLVSVPVSALIAVASRVLMIEDLLLSSSYMTIFKQEFICSEVPLLQLHSLNILAAIVKGLSSQLLPHAPAIIQLLNEYLRRCKFPNLRIKAYAVLKDILSSMGVGITIHISQDVVRNVFYDLDNLGGQKDNEHPNMHAKVHVESQKNSHHRKKRKHSTTTESYQEQPSYNASEVDAPKNMTPITVKIAALEILEALLTVGGLMRSETWRANIESLLVNIAANACKGPWPKEGKQNHSDDDPTRLAQFKLAALRALHVSLLSPSQTRPSHLAQGLNLFRGGLLETGTRVAQFCGHALLTLEVLVHPRSLPVFDLEPSNIRANTKLNDNLHIKQFPTFHGGPDDPESEEDDLNLNWSGKDEMEIEAPDNALPVEEVRAVTGVSVTKWPKENETTISSNVNNDKNMVDENIYILESPKELIFSIQETEADDRVGVTEKVEIEPTHKRIIELTETDIALDETTMPSASDQDMKTENDATDDAILERTYAADTSNTESSRELLSVSDDESDDSLPDIVDGDPDSD